MKFQLPIGNSPEAITFPYFPTAQQAIIWRNWGLVPVHKLAEVLETKYENILELAEGMGLKVPPTVNGNWIKRGYLTIIRRNWHLLTYEQLLSLLDWSEEKLFYVLKEDDFLYVKLGNHKPYVKKTIYSPLSEEEVKKTVRVREIIQNHFPSDVETSAKYFDFLKDDCRAASAKYYKDREIKENEVMLDSSWCLSYDTANEPADIYAGSFTDELDNKWGIRLSIAPDSKENCICLFIEPDKEKKKESHKIEITKNQIKIKAVDEAGLLRGLQYLIKEMEASEGPFLRIKSVERKTRFDLRIAYSYFAVYGNPFEDPGLDPYPDEILSRLSGMGVNGIWLQGILYNMVLWERAPELSADRSRWIEGLSNLVRRAARYGIGVYLYMNEPRAMPLKFYEDNPDLRGHTEGEFAALCTSQEAVKKYIRDGMHKLFTEVPKLAGVITITMSENLTNCYSHATKNNINCPRCINRNPNEVAAEVNRLIAEGVLSAKSDADILCWNWGWNRASRWDEKMVTDAIKMLPKGVSLMCTSEDEMPFNISGIDGYVEDYSMSKTGPSEKSVKCWKHAMKNGLKAVAKVQINNTWECSAVPYLPVLNLVDRHMKNLTAAGVTGLMLGWTLGGYPSINLELVSQYYWDSQEDHNVPGTLYYAIDKFGEKAGGKVDMAWNCFSDAFKEFPFHINVIYTAPQNFGPANLLFFNDTGYKATMIGFPYDDLKTWRGIYPEDIFEKQFENLCRQWKKGIEFLNSAREDVNEKGLSLLNDMTGVAYAAYCHFRSTYLQIAYNRLRVSPHDNKEKIIVILDEEIDVAMKLSKIAASDPRIGFEASNHYYYTLQDLKEKVINCEYLKSLFELIH